MSNHDDPASALRSLLLEINLALAPLRPFFAVLDALQRLVVAARAL